MMRRVGVRHHERRDIEPYGGIVRAGGGARRRAVDAADNELHRGRMVGFMAR